MVDADLHVTVEEVMSEPVATIPPDATVAEAAEKLYADRIGSLVVDGGEGILTETDVVGVVARGADPSTPVAEVASESIVTVERSARIETAAERMRTNAIKKLPVTEDGEVVGIVTTTDVSNYFPSYHPREETWSDP